MKNYKYLVDEYDEEELEDYEYEEDPRMKPVKKQTKIRDEFTKPKSRKFNKHKHYDKNENAAE